MPAAVDELQPLGHAESVSAASTWHCAGQPRGATRSAPAASAMQRFKRVSTHDESEPEAPRRPHQRHLMLLHTAQETLLLLLLGVSSNVFAYGMDKSIEQLVAMRARAAQEAGGFLPSYLLWSGSALVLCALSAACAQHISSAAVGSGIPQMKCVLAGGARIDHYLSARTLAAKVLSLVLAIGGGLAVGKEGPYVHISTCVAQQLCRLPLFRRLNETEALLRQMLAAGCAAGVAATFGAPVGGVLFSIEVTATYYSVAHLWKAMFTAVAAAVVFRVTRLEP